MEALGGIRRGVAPLLHALGMPLLCTLCTYAFSSHVNKRSILGYSNKSNASFMYEPLLTPMKISIAPWVLSSLLNLRKSLNVLKSLLWPFSTLLWNLVCLSCLCWRFNWGLGRHGESVRTLHSTRGDVIVQNLFVWITLPPWDYFEGRLLGSCFLSNYKSRPS